ncbi:MAG TPA: cob(I)yrinic acid a,c-diamide adenosyltransferase [Rhodanobacteraceae bacterium]|nr:cob(I)yrinic acid a,c-diamide adenosyltransferase [Rhodanobacteraceae bacterium]
MGNRLSKVVTRTGDKGTTGLADNTRRPKTDARIVAIGTLDELNCCVGLVLVEELPAAVRSLLGRSQHELFDLGGELSIPGVEVIKAEHVTALEDELTALNDDLPPLKEFVLPGGNHAAAAAHLARAVARRAERCLWALAANEAVNPHSLQYLNRYSDALFVICRVLARQNGGQEVMWKHERQRGPHTAALK